MTTSQKVVRSVICPPGTRENSPRPLNPPTPKPVSFWKVEIQKLKSVGQCHCSCRPVRRNQWINEAIIWDHRLQSKRTSLLHTSQEAARDRHRGLKIRDSPPVPFLPAPRVLKSITEHQRGFRSCKLMLRKMAPTKAFGKYFNCNEWAWVYSLPSCDYEPFCSFGLDKSIFCHPGRIIDVPFRDGVRTHSRLGYHPPILKSLFQECCPAANETFPAPVFDPRIWLGVCTSFTQSPVMTSLCRTIVISPHAKAV